MPTGDQSDDREIDLNVQEKTSENIPLFIVTFFLNRLEWKVGDIKMNTELEVIRKAKNYMKI